MAVDATRVGPITLDASDGHDILVRVLKYPVLGGMTPVDIDVARYYTV